MAITIDLDTVKKDLGLLKDGVTILKNGNWQAALDALQHGDTRHKIVADIDMAETVTKVLALAFPVAGEAIIAMEVIKMMVVYGKGPADFGDPVWGVHSGEVEGPNPSI